MLKSANVIETVKTIYHARIGRRFVAFFSRCTRLLPRFNRGKIAPPMTSLVIQMASTTQKSKPAPKEGKIPLAENAKNVTVMFSLLDHVLSALILQCDVKYRLKGSPANNLPAANIPGPIHSYLLSPRADLDANTANGMADSKGFPEFEQFGVTFLEVDRIFPIGGSCFRFNVVDGSGRTRVWDYFNPTLMVEQPKQEHLIEFGPIKGPLGCISQCILAEVSG